MEELIKALTDYQEAVSEYNRDFDSYIQGGGYDWGYHGHYPRERKQEAEDRLKNALNDCIDNRVEEKLKSMGISLPTQQSIKE